jgi:hypothetical protein
VALLACLQDERERGTIPGQEVCLFRFGNLVCGDAVTGVMCVSKLLPWRSDGSGKYAGEARSSWGFERPLPGVNHDLMIWEPLQKEAWDMVSRWRSLILT